MPASPSLKMLQSQKSPVDQSPKLKFTEKFFHRRRHQDTQHHQPIPDDNTEKYSHDGSTLSPKASSSLFTLDHLSVNEYPSTDTSTPNSPNLPSSIPHHKPIISRHSSFLSYGDSKRPTTPVSSFHSKRGSFLFSYDISHRPSVSLTVAKRLEEDLKKLIANYLNSYLGCHTTLTNSGITSGLRSLTSKDLSNLSSLATETFSKSPIMGGMFSQSNQPTSSSQVYTKFLTQIGTLLTKSHQKKNGTLPLRRQLLAILFTPFATRPIDVSLCRTVLDFFQNLLIEFPCETPKQLSQMMNWCLEALHVSNGDIAKIALEKVHFLVGLGMRKVNLQLDSKYLDEVLVSLMHYSAVYSFPSQTLPFYQKIVNLISMVSSHRDRIITEEIGEPIDENFSRSFALAECLTSPALNIHQFTIESLSEFEWPDLKDPSSHQFHLSVISAAHGFLHKYAHNAALIPSSCINQLVVLVYKNYPPSLFASHFLDKSFWHLLVQNILLVLAIASREKVPQTLRSELFDRTKNYLNDCNFNDVKTLLINSLKAMLSEWDITIALPSFSLLTLRCLNKPQAELVLGETLSTFYNRFNNRSRDNISESLRDFLIELKSIYPFVLYGPLLCLIPTQGPQAASRLVVWMEFLSKVLSSRTLFFSELDLIRVILLTSMDDETSYSLGQIVFLTHFLKSIQEFRLNADPVSFKTGQMATQKFLVNLESQIYTYLAAQSSLKLPDPHPIIKHLIALTLIEVRLTVPSLSKPAWLKYIIRWVSSAEASYMMDYDYSSILSELGAVDLLVRRQFCTISTHASLTSFKLPQVYYWNSESPISTPIQPTPTSLPENRLHDVTQSNSCKLFSTSNGGAFFKLISLVYFHLSNPEFDQALPFFWNYGLNPKAKQDEPHAQLLLMLAGERSAVHMNRFIKAQLVSNKKNSLQKSLDSVAMLFGTRRSLLKHLAIPNPAGKPFRLAGTNLSFVTTSVGTCEPVLQESKLFEKLKLSGVSLDEIKTIQSLGWDIGEADTKEDLFQGSSYPVCLASTTFDEICEDEPDHGISNSIFNFQQHKPLLASLTGDIFLLLTTEMTRLIDSYTFMRSNLLYLMMRDEPAWFLRLMLSSMETSQGDIIESRLNDISHLINIRPKLPFQFSFHTFNYLSGWIRRFYRDIKSHDLAPLTQIIPLLSRLIPSSYDITFRELRKAKIDIAYLFNGRFTLPEHNNLFRIPLSQFMASLAIPGNIKVAHIIPKPLFDLSMFRVGQSLFMTRLIDRSPHDSLPLALTLSKFEPINWVFSSPCIGDSHAPLSLCQKKPGDCSLNLEASITHHIEFRSLSGLHSHAWLSYIEKTFEHAGSKEKLSAVENSHAIKLEIILEGIGSIMLSHPNDMQLLSRVVRLLVRVAIQFRRFFSIKSGYSLFIVALFQVYYATLNEIGRQGIKFAITLFYNLHQKSFVFQMIGAIGPFIIDRNKNDPDHTPVLNAALNEWFLCLENRLDFDPFSLLETASSLTSHPLEDEEELGGPSPFLEFIKSHVKPKALYHEEAIFQFKSFSVADIVRLFVTVIAFDPGSLRSEQFIVMLQYLIPFFIRSIGASGLVELTIKSIIPLFVKFSKKDTLFSRILDNKNRLQLEEDIIGLAVGSMSSNNWPQNDRITICIELFRLMGVLLQLGGELSLAQYEELLRILQNIIKADKKFSCSEGPLEAFVNHVIVPTQDVALKTEIAFKTVQQVSSLSSSCQSSANVADLLLGTSVIIHKFVGAYQNQPSQWHTLLPGFLKFGCTRFTGLGLTQPRGSLVIGRALVVLFEVMTQSFPHEMLVELKNLQPNALAFSYIIIPLCSKLTTDDAFIYDVHGILPAQKDTFQRIWITLLSIITGSLTSVVTTSTYASTTEHPLEASLQFLLTLVGIKIIMMKAQKVLFHEIPSTAFRMQQIVQTYVFDPIVNNTYSNRSTIPMPVYSYAAWKLISFWNLSQNYTFPPLFTDSILVLGCLSEIYEYGSVSAVSTRPYGDTASGGFSPRTSRDVQSQVKLTLSNNPKVYTKVLPKSKFEEKARKSYKKVKASGRKFSRSRSKPDDANGASELWSNIPVEHVLNQLEKHSLDIQIKQSHSHSHDLSPSYKGSSLSTSPQFSPVTDSDQSDFLTKSSSDSRSFLDVPGLPPATQDPTPRPIAIIDIETDIAQELDFILSLFNLPCLSN